MPQATHESVAFHSHNRKVAIHGVFSVKDYTLSREGLFSLLAVAGIKKGEPCLCPLRLLRKREMTLVHVAHRKQGSFLVDLSI